jgi:hypothetical protein
MCTTANANDTLCVLRKAKDPSRGPGSVPEYGRLLVMLWKKEIDQASKFKQCPHLASIVVRIKLILNFQRGRLTIGFSRQNTDHC